MYGLADYSAWCYKVPGAPSVITVNAPGVQGPPGCSGQVPGTVQNWGGGTITCLSAPTGGFNQDCSPISPAVAAAVASNALSPAAAAAVVSSCFGVPGDPSACLSFVPVQTYTAIGIAAVLAFLILGKK